MKGCGHTQGDLDLEIRDDFADHHIFQCNLEGVVHLELSGGALTHFTAYRRDFPRISCCCHNGPPNPTGEIFPKTSCCLDGPQNPSVREERKNEMMQRLTSYGIGGGHGGTTVF